MNLVLFLRVIIIEWIERNIHEIPRFVGYKNREKNIRKKKKSHKTIFTCFENILMSTKLHDFTIHKKKYKMQQYSFFKKKKKKPTKFPNMKQPYLYHT